MNDLFGIAVGVVVGAMIALGAVAFIGHDYHEEPEYSCLEGSVRVIDFADGSAGIIGEALICGRDWRISGIYGPTLDEYEGPLDFSNLEDVNE